MVEEKKNIILVKDEYLDLKNAKEGDFLQFPGGDLEVKISSDFISKETTFVKTLKQASRENRICMELTNYLLFENLETHLADKSHIEIFFETDRMYNAHYSMYGMYKSYYKKEIENAD